MRAASRRYLFLVALGILGLAFGAMMRPTRGPDPDPRAVTKLHLFQITAASKSYQAVYGLWPTGFAQFSAGHNSQQIDFLPPGPWPTNDGWGRPLVYKPFNPALGYGTVSSQGRDGRPGGVGKDEDIEERFR